MYVDINFHPDCVLIIIWKIGTYLKTFFLDDCLRLLKQGLYILLGCVKI